MEDINVQLREDYPRWIISDKKCYLQKEKPSVKSRRE